MTSAIQWLIRFLSAMAKHEATKRVLTHIVPGSTGLPSAASFMRTT
jgi:hypothetical protein